MQSLSTTCQANEVSNVNEFKKKGIWMLLAFAYRRVMLSIQFMPPTESMKETSPPFSVVKDRTMRKRTHFVL